MGGRTVRSTQVCFAVLFISAALAGCSRDTPSDDRSQGPAAPVSAAVSSSPAATRTASALPSSSPTQAVNCDIRDLRITPTIGRTGSTILLEFDNESAHSCALEGWPRVTLAEADAQIVSSAQRQYSFPDRRVSLAPHGSAYAYMSYESGIDADGDTRNCRSAQQPSVHLLVSLPSGTTSTVDVAGFQFCTDKSQTLLVWRFIPTIEPLDAG